MINITVKPNHTIYLDLVKTINSKVKELANVNEIFKDIDIDGSLNNADSCIYRTVLKMFDIAVMEEVVSLDQIYVDIEYLTDYSENYEFPYAVQGWFVNSGFIGSSYSRGNEDDPTKFYMRVYATANPKPINKKFISDKNWFNEIMNNYNKNNVYNSGEYERFSNKFVEGQELADKLIPIVKQKFIEYSKDAGIPVSLTKLTVVIDSSELESTMVESTWGNEAVNIVTDFLIKSGFNKAGGKYTPKGPFRGEWLFSANFNNLRIN